MSTSKPDDSIRQDRALEPTEASASGTSTRRRSQDERSSATIASLSEATIALMTEVGFTNLTTTNIAKRAGVSRGAMLHHFPSKVALVIHATGEMWGEVVAAAEKLRAACDPDRPDPDFFVSAIWEEVMAERHVSVSVDIMLAARGDPILKSHLDSWVLKMFASYREAARHAFGRGGLSETECDALIATIASTLRGQRIAEMMAPEITSGPAVRAMLSTILRDRLAVAAK